MKGVVDVFPRRRDVLIGLPALVAAPALFAQPSPVVAAASREALEETLDRELPDLRSLVALQRGEPLLAFHRQGTTADELHDVQSCTKAVLSLLVGIALERGLIDSIDAPILSLLSGQDELARVASQPLLTLRHLLTMTSGFEPSGPTSRRQSDDPRFHISRPLRAAPGTSFLYDNQSPTLLSIGLEAAVKKPAADFAREALFGPLGIQAFKWEKGPNGHCYGQEGLFLRTADMAKIGQLVLRSGRWRDRQVVQKQYVHDATRRQVAGGPPVNAPYGFLWWITEGAEGVDAFYASGFGGQFIWVRPMLDLVVATNAPVGPGFNSRGHAFRAVRRVAAWVQAGAPGK